MIDCISVDNMRQSDAYTIANYVPGLELMYRAAYSVFESVSWYGKIAIVTGSGNNGGDGFALASILKTHGFDGTVFTVGRRLSEDSRHYAEIAKELGVEIVSLHSGCGFVGYDFVVDCLLGTGFQGTVREDYRIAIEAINASGAFVVSVDINSGMNGDTGEADVAVKSDLTITIGYVKNGLIVNGAGNYMKRLVCSDIGIRLFRQENQICNQAEWMEFCAKEGIAETASMALRDGCIYYRCPEWLEM